MEAHHQQVLRAREKTETLTQRKGISSPPGGELALE